MPEMETNIDPKLCTKKRFPERSCLPNNVDKENSLHIDHEEYSSAESNYSSSGSNYVPTHSESNTNADSEDESNDSENLQLSTEQEIGTEYQQLYLSDEEGNHSSGNNNILSDNVKCTDMETELQMDARNLAKDKVNIFFILLNNTFCNYSTNLKSYNFFYFPFFRWPRVLQRAILRSIH